MIGGCGPDRSSPCLSVRRPTLTRNQSVRSIVSPSLVGPSTHLNACRVKGLVELVVHFSGPTASLDW
jgi:hypothetical protein